MTRERLEEWRNFAEDAEHCLIEGKGTKLGREGLSGFIELVEALSAEFERTDKAIKIARDAIERLIGAVEKRDLATRLADLELRRFE
jgi:hypothetical protein